MRDWGKTFRLGYLYGRLSVVLWRGTGWSGCKYFDHHNWRRFG